MALEIDHADYHGAARVEGDVLESPTGIEAAQRLIERMRDDAHAADGLGNIHRGLEREQQQVGSEPLPLKLLVDGQLPEQHDRHLFRAVALHGFWKVGAFDLTGAQGGGAFFSDARLPDAESVGTTKLTGLFPLSDLEIPFFVDDTEFKPKSWAGVYQARIQDPYRRVLSNVPEL